MGVAEGISRGLFIVALLVVGVPALLYVLVSLEHVAMYKRRELDFMRCTELARLIILASNNMDGGSGGAA